MMFQIGDCVTYGIHGVCRIIGRETKRIDKKNVEYYILEPIDDSVARFYVPVQNQSVVSKLHPILSKEELDCLIRSKETFRNAWITDENERKQTYRNLITAGDRQALMCMVHAIHQQKEELDRQGKKLHLCDINFLRDAEKILDMEFSLVLGIDEKDVSEYIQTALNQ